MQTTISIPGTKTVLQPQRLQKSLSTSEGHSSTASGLKIETGDCLDLSRGRASVYKRSLSRLDLDQSTVYGMTEDGDVERPAT